MSNVTAELIPPLRRAIGRLVRAARAFEMRGAQPPEDMASIDAEFKSARRRVTILLNRIEQFNKEPS